MDYLQKLLADGNGDPSMMRAMSAISLLSGIAIAAVGMYKGKDISSVAVLASVFVGSAFGGKALQAQIESKSN